MDADTYSRRSVVKAGDIIEGRYRIINELGIGSMGSVFLAEHVLIKRRVAIKILRPELVEDPDVLDGFMNEARAAGTLGHPNIVECTDMGLTRTNVPYIVLEYIEGVLLTDEIYRVRGLPIRRALKIADRIAAALYAAHNAGIVHRDLKSDNVFLTDKEDMMDVVKVLDFGVSRLLGGREAGRDLVVGTPEFMAPEQVTYPEGVDHRADIYSLGVILYEMLTARRPFSGEDQHELLHRVVHDLPPPMNLPDAPPGLEEMLFSKMLAKDPEQRYNSMKQVQGALDAFATVVRPRPISSEVEVIRSAMPAAHSAPHAAARIDGAPPEAVALPPLPRERSWSVLWLISAVLAGVAGGALMVAEQRMTMSGDRTMRVALEADAQHLAGLLESEVRAAHLRVDGLATNAMLRNAVVTDAATMKDMAGSDFIFSPRPGEVLEVFQIREGHPPASLLRLPDGASPIAPITGTQSRLASDGRAVLIVVGAPVATEQSITGELAISTPVDLTAFAKRVGEHARAVSILGLGAPVPVIGDAAASSGGMTLPIPLGAELKQLASPSLATALATPAGDRRNELHLARLACWGLSGALLVFFVVGSLRGRKRR
jgi:tRNA A-37 threonylcarbamoyl transferase component Bud32